LKYILFFLFALELVALENYSLRAAYGIASKKDLSEIAMGDFSAHPKHLTVLALDGGYLLERGAFDLPLDIYFKGSLSYFDESAAQKDDIYEVTLYIKAYYNLDFKDNRVRFGLGEGASYTTSVLFEEIEESIESGDKKTSRFLNYLDISVDFDLGKLVHYKELEGAYVGWAIKHRSGIFGLINSVRRGGSNYNTIYIEKNF